MHTLARRKREREGGKEKEREEKRGKEGESKIERD